MKKQLLYNIVMRNEIEKKTILRSQRRRLEPGPNNAVSVAKLDCFDDESKVINALLMQPCCRCDGPRK